MWVLVVLCSLVDDTLLGESAVKECSCSSFPRLLRADVVRRISVERRTSCLGKAKSRWYHGTTTLLFAIQRNKQIFLSFLLALASVLTDSALTLLIFPVEQDA